MNKSQMQTPFRQGSMVNSIAYPYSGRQHSMQPQISIKTVVALPVLIASAFVLSACTASGVNELRDTSWELASLSGSDLLFMVGLVLTFGEQMVLGLDSVTLGLLLLPIITTVLAVVMLVAAVIAWIRGYWSTLGCLYYSLITLAALVFVWWANYWNLIGWRF